MTSSGSDDAENLRSINKKLKESEEKFRSLYTTMAEGVAFHEIIYDKSGVATDYRVIDVNPSYEKILGIPKEKAIGKAASDLYGTGEPPYLEDYAKVAQSGESTTFQTYFAPLEALCHLYNLSEPRQIHHSVFRHFEPR